MAEPTLKVVIHQAVGMAEPIKPGTHFTEQINPTLAVSIAKVDVLAPVTARSNVVQPAGEFDS